ncbi:MAG: agmatine deiminase family protein [Ignavibacteria bacterium]
MKKLLLLLISFLFAANLYSQDLPHFMNGSEKELYKNYKPPFANSDFITPPPTPVRTMAEWEEVQGIIVAWTSYTSIIRQIVDYAQDEGLVFIVCSDSNSVRSYLTSGGVPLVNLKFIITSFNSVWCRDYGPWAVYSGIADSLKLIDWIYNRPRPLDDNVSVGFSNYTSLPIYQTTQAPNDLIGTGGNFMVDGNGTGFSSRLITDENSGKTEAQIDTIMRKYMGINRYIKMNTLPYDNIHHIDMHIKLIDEETLLVGQYPAGVADGPQIEANLQYVLNNFQTCYGRPYKVVRIPMPPSSSGQYPPSANYYTYTNSVFINKTVIVPIYGLAQDTTALRIYRDNLPGYRVVGINCSGMISALGAIHCITKEIGVAEPIFFSYPKLSNTFNTTVPYEVKSYIKTKSGVGNAKVFWRTDTTAAYSQLAMAMSSGDTFKVSIPAQPWGTKVYYYVSATSVSGRTITKPLTAPAGYYKFIVDKITKIYNINGTIGYMLNQNFPNPFNPVSVISYQLSSAGNISLKVYDVLGNEVSTLVSAKQNAGEYRATFDGSNLASGIYFYKLIADGIVVDTKKMLLVK